MSAKSQMEREIREAYAFLRTNNMSIPSDILDFMLDASLKKLNEFDTIPLPRESTEELLNESAEQLLEDYQRKLSTIEGMLREFKSNGSEHDIEKKVRLTTKASEYRSFITELARIVCKPTILRESEYCVCPNPKSDMDGKNCTICNKPIM
jgi:hypothetical protein